MSCLIPRHRKSKFNLRTRGIQIGLSAQSKNEDFIQMVVAMGTCKQGAVPPTAPSPTSAGNPAASWKHASPSIKLKALKDDAKLEGAMADLVANTRKCESHGNCPDNIMKLLCVSSEGIASHTKSRKSYPTKSTS
jgi:hypothetical protein